MNNKLKIVVLCGGLALLTLGLVACRENPEPLIEESTEKPIAPPQDTSSAPSNSAIPTNSNIPSSWQGVAQIQTSNQVFEQPILLEVGASRGQGYAPLRFSLTTLTSSSNPNAAPLGTIRLLSETKTSTSLGEPVILDFYNIQMSNSGFQATLTEEQGQTSSSLNSFVAPPPPIDPRSPMAGIERREMEATGGAIEYIFRPGTQLVVNFQGDEIVGGLQGNGFSGGLMFSGGDIPLKVIFKAQKKR